MVGIYRAVLVLLLSSVISIAAPAFAAVKGMDCPAATRPYSVDTVLLDIYLNPESRALVEQESPDFFRRLPPWFSRTEPPTFMAINSLRQANGGVPAEVAISKDGMARLDARLAALPVTEAASIARCARYDETAPPLPANLRQPAILVFSKITGFRDGPSVDAATAALTAMAQREGWTIVFSDNGAVFNAENLKLFKAVVWNNVSGDVLTNTQRGVLKDYIEHGGGFAAFHGSGGDPYYDWNWYVDTLIGARFIGHTGNPQFQQARVIIDDPQSAIVKGLTDWTMTEEWYSFQASPRLTGAHILARLDESTYNLVDGKRDLHMGDHPIAWTRCVGSGRSFYSAIGHRPENYSEPSSILLLERGIAWAAGLGETQCVDGREVAKAP
ncbi:MAG: ThuA domain-containing protein [Asticcacaulis sp.]|nr:ThuA domain-containing protein [Asticcacaulis sp.]